MNECSYTRKVKWGIMLLTTHLSAVARAIQSTWVTCWPLLDGDSIGGTLQTLPKKVEAKAWSIETKTLITLVSKKIIAAGA